MTLRSPASVRAPARPERATFPRARDAHASEPVARFPGREQLGAFVAHELKNPITGVKALVQLGLRNPAEVASHRRLAIIEREIARMQDILQRYLSFSRSLGDVATDGVELGPLVAETLLALSARAEEARVRLCARGDARVEGDPRGLREALLNLVANAVEASAAGGEVAVEVGQTAGAVEIAIRDSGRGMSAETLRRLGTPFFTTREDGTGLGVMLARAVIAQHGGTLRYESEPGKGTTVTATLPRAPVRGASAVARGPIVSP